MAWWHSNAWRSFGTLLLIWLVLNLPLLLGIRVLPWDAIDEFYPTVFFNAHSLRQGLAPWWNPYIYAGYPQIADPQGMLFSPLLMMWMLLPPNPGATWFVWGILLHLLMGGAAVQVILRQLGSNTFGTLMGALVFMAGGVAASRLEHVPIVIAYAYAPVALLALRHFLAAPSWRRGLWLGMSVGFLLTQLVQLTYLILLMLVAYGFAGSLWRLRTYSRQLLCRWLTGLAVAALIALAVGLPQLLFSLSFSTWSNRSDLPLEASTSGSLDLRAFLSLLNPNALHALRGTYTGPADVVEAFFYIGAIPSLLLVGLKAAWRNPLQRRQLLFFAGVGTFAILYLLGVNTGFYRWLYSWLPGAHLFRRPSDSAYLLNLTLAISVGLAASHARLSSGPWRISLLAIASVWLVLSSLTMRDSNGQWQAASIFAALVSVAGIWQLRKNDVSELRVAVWMLAVVVADYRCFNLNGTFNQVHDSARYIMRNDAARFISEASQPSDHTQLMARVEPLDVGGPWDNLIVLWPLASTQGYNPLRYALYDHWYGARSDGSQPRPSTLYNRSADGWLTNLLSVQYLVRTSKGSDSDWNSPKGYTLAYRDEKYEVWHNAKAYPRLLTPIRSHIQNSDYEFQPSDFARADFNEEVWLTPRDAVDHELAAQAAGKCGDRLRIVSVHATPTSVTVQTSADGAGWLVLSDLDFPGWRASANGKPLPIHRANGMFRSVCVPAGVQVVDFRFHPWLMVASAWKQRRKAAKL